MVAKILNSYEKCTLRMPNTTTTDSEDEGANSTQAGKVEIFNWSDLLQSNVTVTSSINGDRSYARFGSNVQVRAYSLYL